MSLPPSGAFSKKRDTGDTHWTALVSVNISYHHHYCHSPNIDIVPQKTIFWVQPINERSTYFYLLLPVPWSISTTYITRAVKGPRLDPAYKLTGQRITVSWMPVEDSRLRTLGVLSGLLSHQCRVASRPLDAWLWKHEINKILWLMEIVHLKSRINVAGHLDIL